MNDIPFSKEQKTRKVPTSLSLSFQGQPEPRSGRKPARLIDPVVSLTADWLICQPVKTLFSTEPNSHFIGCLRIPIHSSDAQIITPRHSVNPFFQTFFLPLGMPCFIGFSTPGRQCPG
jgi:hypothetical protein